MNINENNRIYLTNGNFSSIASLLLYESAVDSRPVALISSQSFQYGKGVIGIIGAGNSTSAKVLPELKPLDAQRSMIQDNWRSAITGFGFKGFTRQKMKPEKVHAEQFRRLVDRLMTGGEAQPPFKEIIYTMRASFAAITSLKEGRWVEVPEG